MSLPMEVSGDRVPAVWSFPLTLPTTCNSSFSFYATSQVAAKGFSSNGDRGMYPIGGFTKVVLVAGMPITGETERTGSTEGGFGSVRTITLGRERKVDRSLYTSSMLVYGRSRWSAFSGSLHPDNWVWRQKLYEL